MKKVALAVCALMMHVYVFALLAHAQGNGVAPSGNGGNHALEGQVYLPSGRRSDVPLRVKLQSDGAGGELSVTTSAFGTFSFLGLAPGNYTVVIEGSDEFERASERVFIDKETGQSAGASTAASGTGQRHTVIVHLRGKRSTVDVNASVVDVNASLIPDAARKQFDKGLSLAKSGDSKKAIDTFKSALAQYPTFASAHNELGVQYLKLGQPDKAVESLREAVKLSPDAYSPNLNLGIALLETKQFEAAESQLGEAIKRRPTSPTAHMYLGIALLSLKKLPEAQAEFETAVGSNAMEIAKAHYYLGGIYWGNRDYNRAAEELETYLKLVPKAPEALKVRETINELRNKK
jgi:tetratricopeptide (TPR) repeat protein